MDARGARANFSGLDVPGAGARCSVLTATMAVASIAGVAVVVADGSPSVIVIAIKDLVAVKVEAALMVPPLIRRALLPEPVVRSTGTLLREWRPPPWPRS